MRDILVSTKQLITKAVFLSFVVHFLLLSILVFCFPIPPGVPKPFFVFLGSILQKQDFLISGLRYSSTPIPLNSLLAIEDSQRVQTVSVEKPHFHKTIPFQGKPIFKSPKSPEGEQDHLEPVEKKINRDFPTPAYVPLRLYTK